MMLMKPKSIKFINGHFSSISIDLNAIYASLIDRSTHIDHLRQIQAQIVTAGLQRSLYLGTKFVHACSNVGHVIYAREVFVAFDEPNVFLWNVVIRAHSRHGLFVEAVRLFRKMGVQGVSPDGFTFPPVLKSCGAVADLEAGRQTHARVVRLGIARDAHVLDSVVSMYAKCGDMDRARQASDELGGWGRRSVVSWTALVSGFAQNGRPGEAWSVFCEMVRDSGVSTDSVALVSALKACADAEAVVRGRSVHAHAIKSGLESESDLLVALTAMYAKCGDVWISRWLFDVVPCPDLLLWNAMISGYAKNGHACEAVKLFDYMLSFRGAVKPDSITVRSAISAYAQLGSLELARWMENYVNASGFVDDAFVNSALIDMYAKCGSIDLARETFDRTCDKDVVVWSTMISGYGLHGRAREAFDLFHAMRLESVKPNDVTFLGLLSACNHSGLVREGLEYFRLMQAYAIEPRHLHYACVVDLLARAGRLNEAIKFVEGLPTEPPTNVWGALLNACKVHGDVGLGVRAASRVLASDATNVGYYVQLSNVYALAGMWEEVDWVRVMMKGRGLSKDFGRSDLEIDGAVRSFGAGDESDPRHGEVFGVLGELEGMLREGWELVLDGNSFPLLCG
ncbi:Pentatricopeptide repeat-containing protein [Acorus gramineus]|uniref:Pentatricopeptide repeat-containing protein n=1 Tax=Acorus gramineus TaxID=55184 RepID=A0AAV9BW98_ACOGR|nr:Pentatricopeptide repeat-containing protein [Acorus gramineus]